MKIPTTKSFGGKLPIRKSSGAAGYDLVSTTHARMLPGSRHLILTGLRVAIPAGHYMRIAPRSGLAKKHGIGVLAGVIDSDYRGEIGVVLINHGEEDFIVCPGDAIAQAIIERCYDAEFVEFGELPETVRGEGGFGSTGR